MVLLSFLNKLSYKQHVVFIISALGILIGAIGVVMASDRSFITFFENLHWTFSIIGTAFVIGLGLKKSKPNVSNKHLKWFFVGFALYALGLIVWDIQALVSYSAFPAPSDIFFLLLGPSLCIALYYELKAHYKKINMLDFWLDFSALSIVLLTIILISYLPRQGEFDTLSLLVLVLYPITLMLPVLMIVLMIPTMGLRIDAKLLIFLSASSINALLWADWNSMALDGKIVSGGLSNVIFSISILFMGLIISNWKLAVNENIKYNKTNKFFLNLLPLITVTLSFISIIIISKLSISGMVQELSYVGAVSVILLSFIRLSRLVHENDKIIEAQEELINASSLINSIIQATPVRIFWKDSDLNFLGSNDLFAHDAGLETSKDLIGKSDFDMTWKDQAQLYRDDDLKVMQSGKAVLGYEEPQTRPNGDTIWLRTSKVPLINESNGEVVGILGVYDDITELKKIEEHLSTQNYIFKKSQELAHIGSWRHDLVKNKLTWSDEIYYIFEKDSKTEEPSYEGFLNAIHPDDRDAVNSAYANSLETKKRYQISHRLLMQDGRIKYVQEQCETSFDEQGEPLVSLGTVQDITEQKLIEDLLQENQLIMTQQARSASMGEMIGNIAHQWRQPLNALSLNMQKLPLLHKREKLSEERIEAIVTKGLGYIDGMSKTIDDFRDFFNPDKEKEHFYVKDSIDQAYAIIEATLKNASINYTLTIAENKKLYGFSNELSQVIINILNNAKDAFLEGEIEDRFISIDVQLINDSIEIVISDNAGGISDHILYRIFEPYFTTKEQGKGTGVGLYMSKTIIEEHMNGTLVAQSSEGTTTFTIKI